MVCIFVKVLKRSLRSGLMKCVCACVEQVLSLCLLRLLPVPLVRCKSNLLPYRRGGCSSIARQSKEQQEETALCTVFPLALRGYS